MMSAVFTKIASLFFSRLSVFSALRLSETDFIRERFSAVVSEKSKQTREIFGVAAISAGRVFLLSSVRSSS